MLSRLLPSAPVTWELGELLSMTVSFGGKDHVSFSLPKALCSYPGFVAGQQSQFNCTAGLLESVTTPEQVIDKSCFLATNFRRCRSEHGTVFSNQFLSRLQGSL